MLGLSLGLILGLILGPRLRSNRSPRKTGTARPGLSARLLSVLPASRQPAILRARTLALAPPIRPEDEKAARLGAAISGYKLLRVRRPGSNGPCGGP